MTLPATPAGRDARGRFAPGNTLGRGNPFAGRVAAMRAALFEEIDETHFRTLVRGLVQMARDKNLAAMRLILLYLVGKPADVANPYDLDPLEDEPATGDPIPQAEAPPAEEPALSVETADPPVEPPPAATPAATVTKREERPAQAANDGQSTPTWYLLKRRQKNRRKKARGKR